MPEKDQYRHACNTIIELTGENVFELRDPDFAVFTVKRLQDRMKKYYTDGKKPEKIFIYMLATDSMGVITKMTGGDDGEAGK